MKIAITGGTGFLGCHLSKYFSDAGDDIILISRADLKSELSHLAKLIKSVDVVINLAGSPVIKRWSEKNKKMILQSRIKTSDSLVDAILFLSPEERPKVVLSASAIGIYDHHGIHDENSKAYGNGFLSEVCRHWERCFEPLKSTEVRFAIFRIGLVMGKDGGMLKQLLPVFKSGFGGRVGSGNQGFSFVHIDDLCSAFNFVIQHTKCDGIFNMVAPNYVTNSIFTNTLAKILHRPAFFLIPEIMLKLVYGEAASALLKGESVIPKHLLDKGFQFKYPDIESTLKSLV